MPVSSEHRGRAGGEQPGPSVQLACTLVHVAHPEIHTRGLKRHEKVPAMELREVVSARQRKVWQRGQVPTQRLGTRQDSGCIGRYGGPTGYGFRMQRNPYTTPSPWQYTIR